MWKTGIFEMSSGPKGWKRGPWALTFSRGSEFLGPEQNLIFDVLSQN